LSKTATKLSSRALVKNDWPVKELGGLTLLFSPLLSAVPSLVHCFTTRKGGESPPPLDCFNLGRHWPTEESKQDAMRNRSRLCAALSLDFTRLVVPGQVHSTNIAWVSDPENLPEVDGVATASPNTPILLHYADCVPIILFERELKVLAVLHAGWRGTAGGIATRAVSFMVETLSLKPAKMLAAIGPAIGSCCYQVGADVAEKLSNTVKHGDRLIVWRDQLPYPDLRAINAMQLLEAGVHDVDVSSVCTACQPQLFYSHRQSAGQTGRQGALAAINESM